MQSETACAKINLALHVRARRSDGYHDIESLFAFARDGDVLHAAPSDAISLAITGPFAGGLAGEGDNLVLRAARLLAERFGVRQGAALTLEKNLPVAAGIGGGSADAAAALRLLARLWGIDWADERLMTIARELGADVPACLLSRTVFGTGKGDALAPVDAPELAGMPLLLVNPGIALATGPVFAGWDAVDRGALAVEGDLLAAAIAGRNDLEQSAIAIVPAIGAILAHLSVLPGIRLARMSGSGATCFALFATPELRTAAAESIRQRWPDYWLLETALG